MHVELKNLTIWIWFFDTEYLDLGGVYSAKGTSTQSAVYVALYVLATSMLCLSIPPNLKRHTNIGALLQSR